MRGRLVIGLIVVSTVLVGLLFLRHILDLKKQGRPIINTCKLRVLTYSTFVGSGGPGAELFDFFKNEQSCEVDVQTAGDAGLLLERAKLANESVPFDVVIGLDQLMLSEAREKLQWRPLSPQTELVSELKNFSFEGFIPYDFSPLGLIYREGEGPVPTSLTDLIGPDFKKQLALQDPRSSSPGLQFYHWIRATQKDKTETFLQELKPSIHSISPSWSFAYGLFKKEQARFVFSYMTSLAYHWGTEKDRRYQFAVFSEGHPVQVEFAGVLAQCRQCEKAEAFVQSLLSRRSQKILMEKNYMLPVVPGLREGTVFSELPSVPTLATPLEKDFRDWEKVFGR